jgi:site-specific DNA-cytosine methylase
MLSAGGKVRSDNEDDRALVDEEKAIMKTMDYLKKRLEEIREERVFGDVRSRIPDQPEMEDNDMYFASAPCQPFSSSGKGLGTEDRDGLLIFAAITYMVMNKPIMALFEQVPLASS